MSALTSPVILTNRADIKDALRTTFSELGAKDVFSASTADECVEQLFADRDRLLCLDWAIGDEEAIKVLGALKGKFLIETRPCLVLVPNVDHRIISMAGEYGVSRIHVGAISKAALAEAVNAIIAEHESDSKIREQLIMVADARSRSEWEASTMILQDLHEQHPGHPRLVVELAENLVAGEYWEQAQAILAPLVSAEEPPVRALHLMGRCHMHDGDFDAAIGQLERAKIINPLNVDRLLDLGEAFLGADNIEKALENFKAAGRLEPNNQAASKGRGKCLLMQGQLNEALDILKQCSGPREMASVFNTAAILSIRAGRFAKGMALYQAAVSATGGNAEIASRLIFNMGVGYKRQNMWDKAWACFHRSLELDQKFAKAATNKKQAETKLAQLGVDPGSIDGIQVGVKMADAFGEGAEPASIDAEEDDYVALGSEKESPANVDLDAFDKAVSGMGSDSKKS